MNVRIAFVLCLLVPFAAHAEAFGRLSGTNASGEGFGYALEAGNLDRALDRGRLTGRLTFIPELPCVIVGDPDDMSDDTTMLLCSHSHGSPFSEAVYVRSLQKVDIEDGSVFECVRNCSPKIPAVFVYSPDPC